MSRRGDCVRIWACSLYSPVQYRLNSKGKGAGGTGGLGKKEGFRSG